MSSHPPQGIPSDLKKMAELEARLYNLERRALLDAQGDDDGGCCTVLCAFKSGTSTLDIGEVETLSVPVHRGRRGRFIAWGVAATICDTGGDFMMGARFRIGATYYEPWPKIRMQGASTSDGGSVSPVVAKDFSTASTDLTVELAVQNLGSVAQTWYTGALIVHVFYSRDGSVECSPATGGT